MDLDFHGDRNAANIVLNKYVGAAPQGHEIEGLATLPLFLAVRAAVRAVVSVERARQHRDSLSSLEAYEHRNTTWRGLTRRPVTSGLRGNTDTWSGDSTLTPLPSPGRHVTNGHSGPEDEK